MSETIDKLAKPKYESVQKIEKIENRTKKVLEEKKKKLEMRAKINEPTFTPKLN